MFQAEVALLRRTPNRAQPTLHASSCGLEVIHATRIPTHGGSIRVCGTRKGRDPVQGSVSKILDEEKRGITADWFAKFKRAVVQSKLDLLAPLKKIKRAEAVSMAPGPSRASTLINYVGLDNGILDCVLEINGSYKIGKYISGTIIPVWEENVFSQSSLNTRCCSLGISRTNLSQS
jgi:hypothetical protein